MDHGGLPARLLLDRRADTFYNNIGVSFGTAMLGMIETTLTVNDKAVKAAGKQAKARYGS